MSARPYGILFSRDRDLLDRLEAVLAPVADLVRAETVEELVTHLARRAEDAVVVADLRDGDRGRRVGALAAERSAPFVLIGDAHEDSSMAPGVSGAFALEAPDADPERWRSAVRHAWEQHELKKELSLLRERLNKEPAPAPPTGSGRARGLEVSAAHLLRVLQSRNGWEEFVRSAVDVVASTWMISRVGVFLRDENGVFRLHSGVGCPAAVQDLCFDERDALVRWAQRHACVIALTTLEASAPADIQAPLRAALDLLGAELLLPLQARGEVFGWLFASRPGRGLPYQMEDIEEFSALAWQLGMLIDHAWLSEEREQQRRMADQLIETLETGVAAAGPGGDLQLCNPAARRMLGLAETPERGAPIETLGSRVAGALRETLAGATLPPEEWDWPDTGRRLEIQTKAIDAPGGRMAVGYLYDVTDARLRAAQEDERERMRLWMELARAMAHEIRNPLVAIRSAGPLLSEHYADPEFRKEFTRLVEEESLRLDGLVGKLETLAQSAEARPHAPLDLPALVSAALAAAARRAPDTKASVETRLAPDLPAVSGHADSIRRALEELLVNAMESSAEHIVIAAEAAPSGTELKLSVEDDGHGIPPELKDRLFSPFVTTKAQGMGLGLPRVRNVVLDHDGKLLIHTSDAGTRMTMVLRAPPAP